MKKVVRIKESELVNLIDKIITETTRKQKITEGVRNKKIVKIEESKLINLIDKIITESVKKVNKTNKYLKENFSDSKNYYVATGDMDEPGELKAHLVSPEQYEEYYENGWDLEGPFTEKEANDYLDGINKSNADWRYHSQFSDDELSGYGKSNLKIDPSDKFERGSLDTNW